MTQRRERLQGGGAVAHVNEWRHLCKQYGCVCLCCREATGIDKLTRDHIIPVGLPGSSNGVDNLQPLCMKCNGLKGRLTIDFRPDRSSLMDCVDHAMPTRLAGKRLERESRRTFALRQIRKIRWKTVTTEKIVEVLSVMGIEL